MSGIVLNSAMRNPTWPTPFSHALIRAGAMIVLTHHLLAAGLVGSVGASDRGGIGA